MSASCWSRSSSPFRPGAAATSGSTSSVSPTRPTCSMATGDDRSRHGADLGVPVPALAAVRRGHHGGHAAVVGAVRTPVPGLVLDPGAHLPQSRLLGLVVADRPVPALVRDPDLGAGVRRLAARAVARPGHPAAPLADTFLFVIARSP